VQAGFELIKQWYRESQGKPFEISADLPEDVREVVEKTLKSAQDSWWRYPSREEADDPKKGEKNITDYAKLSYEINRDEIWPEFKKLVDEDIKSQEMQEAIKGIQKKKREGGQITQDLQELTPEEQEELDKALDDAIKKALKESKQAEQGKPEQVQESQDSKQQQVNQKPIDVSKLSEGLKQKISKYINSLPKEERERLEERAKASLEEFEKSVNESLQGKLCQNPEQTHELEKSTESVAKVTEGESWSKSEKARKRKAEELRKK